MKNFKLITKLGAAVFLLLSASMNAIFGVYLGKIVDSISAADKSVFIQNILIAILALVIDMLCGMVGWACAFKDICEKLETLKNKVYQNELKKNRSTDIDISKFSNKIDLLFSDRYVNQWYIYNNTLLFLSCCIAIISINWVMLLVAVFVSVLPMFTPSLFSKYVQKAAKTYSDGSTKYMNYVTDTLQGRLEIIKYGAAQKFCENHSTMNHIFEQTRYHNKVANWNSRVATGTVGNLAIMSLFLVGGILTFTGAMGVGGVMGVIQLMNNVVGPIVSIAESKNQINSCKPVIQELNQEIILKQKSSKADESFKNLSEIVLTVDQIEYQYPETETKLFNHFTYQFEHGKKYLIRGESGAGKTTLAKLLTGELQPDSGCITLNNINIASLSEELLFQIMTYVDQKVYLFDDSILNNILLYRNLDKNKIKSLMNCLGIDQLDIDKVVNDDNGISGGQRARVCLARATVTLPRILIVDEPTAALDFENSKKVMRYLCSLPITVIVISHSVSEEIQNLFDSTIFLETKNN